MKARQLTTCQRDCKEFWFIEKQADNKKWASFIEPFMFIRTSFITMAFAWRPTKSNKGGITKKHNRPRFCTISILHRCNECIVNPERVPPDCNPVIHNKCEVKIAICHLARAQQRMSHSIFVIHFPAILQPQGFTFPTCLHRASYGEDVVMTTTHDNKEEKPLGTSFACLSNIKLQFSCNKGWLEIFCDPKCLGGLEVGGWYRKAVPPAKKRKQKKAWPWYKWVIKVRLSRLRLPLLQTLFPCWARTSQSSVLWLYSNHDSP